MPGPAFAVAAVRVEAERQLVATLSGHADAVDPVDFGDVLNPGSWVLTTETGAQPGTLRPTVARVESVDGTSTPTACRLYLDERLAPSQPFGLRLTATARSADSMSTSTAKVLFTAPALGGIAGQTQGVKGGDLSFPAARSETGDLVLVSKDEAYRKRIERMIEVRFGAFTHLPGYGRVVEPKRTYTEQALFAEAQRLAEQIRSDEDTKAARVFVSKGDHIATFEIHAQPKWAPRPLLITAPITAGRVQ